MYYKAQVLNNNLELKYMSNDKKPGRNFYVGARVSLETKKWLETYAKKMHMTVSAVISRLIEMLKALNGDHK